VAGDIDTGETASLLVNVFGATTIVAAGVGVTLLVLSSGGGESAGGRAPRASVAIASRPGGAMLGVEGAL
jgi:hypothetical protein